LKAIVWTRYGEPDGLELREVTKPIPKDDQVLIRTIATSVTAVDCEMRRLKLPFGLGLPMRLYMGLLHPRNRILGQELAGVIEAVGPAVTRFKVGEEVFGVTGFGFGAYAEYICLPQEAALAGKAVNMSFEEAAVLPTAGLEALHFLRKAAIKPGEKVLIIGAGGSIGTAAVQLAGYYGAEVTAVDSTEKLAMLRALGAAQVLDSTREDYGRFPEHFDVVFEIPGKTSLPTLLKMIKPGGRLLLVNPSLGMMLRAGRISRRSGRQVLVGSGPQTAEDLAFLREMVDAGRLKSVIDHSFPLEEMVRAHRYAESGQKKGNIAIKIR